MQLEVRSAGDGPVLPDGKNPVQHRLAPRVEHLSFAKRTEEANAENVLADGHPLGFVGPDPGPRRLGRPLGLWEEALLRMAEEMNHSGPSASASSGTRAQDSADGRPGTKAS